MWNYFNNLGKSDPLEMENTYKLKIAYTISLSLFKSIDGKCNPELTCPLVPALTIFCYYCCSYHLKYIKPASEQFTKLSFILNP